MSANVSTCAAHPAASDKYHVYRPMLDLIGLPRGTDRKRGYNETLAYGAYSGGDANLVGMTLKQIDALQTKMLKHPKNSLNSSALGRYQIVRTTLRAIRKTLDLRATAFFDAAAAPATCSACVASTNIWPAACLKTRSSTILPTNGRHFPPAPARVPMPARTPPSHPIVSGKFWPR